MLIEFKVTNFRSIHTTQTLSMVAGTGTEHKEQNTFLSGLSSLPNLLRSAAVYGPNAAGKSNLFRAMLFMQNFVLTSQALQEGQNINVAPFLLNSKSRTEPSEFEVSFIHDKVRYQYGFAVNNTRVTNEWLLAYPEGRPQRWFERKFDLQKSSDDWHFGSKFAGSGQLRDLWQKATRQNGLFLSTAIQLNNEQLKPVFNWFQQKLAVILPGGDINLQFSIEQCASEEGKKRIMEFMNSADISITGIELKKIPFSLDILPPTTPQEIKDLVIRGMQGKEMTNVRFLHKTVDSGDIVSFDISDESGGTQKLFAFAGPLLDVLAKGRILFVDELDTSLHPLMVRFLINLIHNSEISRNNAQLAFTTHDTSVLDTDIFRRDQVWFVEKDTESASRLYPLSDFSPRKGEALERGYLKGRYGALPFIGEFKF
ncbi:MAG: ATP-binding protein [Deltaproteobacteria bacterium]|nr:ATP-binding protein [Deltaproteobacteria bacterium]